MNSWQFLLFIAFMVLMSFGIGWFCAWLNGR